MSLAIAVALVCAALMGFAVTRGATCMVAAVDQLMRERRLSRLVAMGEAALLVAGGMTLAVVAGAMPPPVVQHPIGPATIAGAALLGLGAFVNRACVFGAIARLGSGEWHYLLTPLGFLGGCVAAQPLLGAMGAGAPMPPGFAPALSMPVVGGLFLFMLWRGLDVIRAAQRGMLSAHVWQPHQATLVIGLTFVVMLLAVGA